VPLEKIEEHRQEIDARAVDFDTELQPEPIGTVAHRLDARKPVGLLFENSVRIGWVDVHAPAKSTRAQ
jgi:hypothetical protein